MTQEKSEATERSSQKSTPRHWKLVPVEPTDYMIGLGSLSDPHVDGLGLAAQWARMVAAAPAPPAHDEAVVERVAKALYECQWLPGVAHAPWEETENGESERSHFLELAEAAIAATRGVETGSAIESPREMSGLSDAMKECVEALKEFVAIAERSEPGVNINFALALRKVKAKAALAKLEKAP